MLQRDGRATLRNLPVKHRAASSVGLTFVAYPNGNREDAVDLLMRWRKVAAKVDSLLLLVSSAQQRSAWESILNGRENVVIELIGAGSIESNVHTRWLVPLCRNIDWSEQGLSLIKATLNEAESFDLIYFDHLDKCCGRKRQKLVCKPAFDPVYWRGHDYIGMHCLLSRSLFLEAFSKSMAKRVEVLIHDAITCCIDNPKCVAHSPRVISTVISQNEVDAKLSSNSYTALVGQVEPVSVIVPTRDGLPHLKRCIDELLRSMSRTNCPSEICIVDNRSQHRETVRYLNALPERVGNTLVKVLSYPLPFNYSSINNYAVQYAHHEHLLFLNDDVQAQDDKWLPELFLALAQPGAVAAGGCLLYPDGRIQHAGVTVGLGGVAGHPGRGSWPGAPDMQTWHNARFRQMSALTAACLLMRRKDFLATGGFDDQNLSVAFNDVDLCLRLRARGGNLVYARDAVLIHHESLSRGSDDATAEKRARFAAEVRYMTQRWANEIRIDPFYSPHWRLDRADFSWKSHIDASQREFRLSSAVG